MTNENLFYQESETLNVPGIIIAFFSILIATFFLGYLYSILIIFIPLIYFNFFITVGLGMALGYLVKILIRLTHQRSRNSKLALAVLAGLFANLFQWLVYLIYAYLGEVPSLAAYFANFGIFIQPSNFISIIGEINRVGMWSIFGIDFSGGLLTIVWLFEFAMIMAIPIMAIWKSKVFPYSENERKWYGKYSLEEDFEMMHSVQHLLEPLQKDAFKTINELEEGNGLRHSKIHIYYLENERNQYLELEKIYFESGGEGKKTSVVILDNFRIDNQAAKMILAKFKNDKVKFPIF